MRADNVSVVRADWEKAVPALSPLPQNKPRALTPRRRRLSTTKPSVGLHARNDGVEQVSIASRHGDPLAFRGTWLEGIAEFLPQVPSRGDTVIGNANPLKRRFRDEDIELLQCIAWWNWPIDSVTEHVREIWACTPTDLERTGRKAGLLD